MCILRRFERCPLGAKQQRSSGAALGTRSRVAAGLAAKIEAAGDGCFQIFQRAYPRLCWIFLHVTPRRDGSPGFRCRIGDSRYAIKLSNPPSPRVPIRTYITGAKSTRTSSARALFCAQDTLCRLESIRRPSWPLYAATVPKVAGRAHARGLEVWWAFVRERAHLSMSLVVRSREHRHSIGKECMHGT